MAKSKKEWMDEASALGIDVDTLGDDVNEPTIQQLQDAIATVSQELPVNADMFLAYESQQRVPLAGLLAAEPHLQEAELKPSEWHRELEKYLASERP